MPECANPCPVICLLGPTASGKTEMALRLYERGDIDVISVDSAMVYRGLDIGTAKPSQALLAAVPHQLVDIREPQERYSVADFVADANRAIDVSLSKGRLPLLVGGTMLYFKRLFDGLAALPPADRQIRAALDAEALARGWPALHQRLARVDPATAARVSPTDAQRIQRALEVHALSGEPISALQQQQSSGPSRRYLRIALVNDDRAALHHRISQRFDEMLAQGFTNEVSALLERTGVHRELPSMRAVGYRQIARYLSGEQDLALAVADAKTATRRLAKRQFTWLRGMHEIQTVDSLEADAFIRISKLVEESIG